MFDYMAAAAGALRADSTLWAASAWNDNGLPSVASDETAVRLPTPVLQLACDAAADARC